MNGEEKNTRIVSADKPVNRRTASATASIKPAKVTPNLRARMQRLNTHQVLGLPLSQEFFSAAPKAAKLPARHAMVLALLLCGAVLAAFLLPAPFNLIITLAMALSAAITGFIARKQSFNPPTNALLSDIFPVDAGHMTALDEQLEQVATHLPPPLLDALRHLKQDLVSTLRAAQQQGAASWSFEDKAWVTQCLSRYLPDSLSAYLAIPSDKRTHCLPGEKQTADESLLAQLQYLQEKLQQLQNALSADKMERLAQQERFLRAKGKGH